jgi:hypothetical protein
MTTPAPIWSQRLKQGPLPANWDPAGGCLRVAQDAPCRLCGAPAYDHPHDWAELGWDGHAFLRVLCDGTRAKL